MGVRASTLTGRAVVDGRLRHVTTWKEKQIDDMLIAHEHDLGGRFALALDPDDLAVAGLGDRCLQPRSAVR